MESLVEVVSDALRAQELRFTELDGSNTLLAPIAGVQGHWNCVLKVSPSQRLVSCYSMGPTKVPADKRAPVCEFFTLANYGMPVGNFEMDMDDGEFRFKTYMIVGEDMEFRRDAVRVLVGTNVATMDRYLKGVMEVVYGSLSPSEACARVESDEEDEASDA